MAKEKYGYLINDDIHVYDNLKDCLEVSEPISTKDILKIYRLSYVDSFPLDVDSLMWEADETWGWYGTAALNYSCFTNLTSEEVNDFKAALDRVTRKHLGKHYYVIEEDLLGSVRFSTADIDSYNKNNRLSRDTIRQIAAIKRKLGQK